MAPALTPGTRPSAALPDEAWAAAHEHLVTFLQDILRIPSINPPDPPGPELDAANRIADELRSFGMEPEVLEPFPGRGSVFARLRGDGTGGDPFLLLSHLDVVPADRADGWTHGPFDGDIADGYVWGRGAVDMKGMVALEIGVLRLLAARAREAGLDPATDPVPGLRRDVLFACTADEENGGWEGAGWVVDHRPDLLRAAGGVNEAGGVSAEIGGRRFYPIQVAEKGHEVFRIHVHGTWGHGSMPRDDNALVMAAEAVRRLAEPGEPRVTPVMRASREVGEALGAGPGGAARGGRRRRSAAVRGGAPPAVRPDVRPRAPRAHPRLDQPGRAPRGDEVQRDPGRGDDRDRHPHAPGDDAGRYPRGGPRPARRPRAALRARADPPQHLRSRRLPRASCGSSCATRSAPTIPTASRSR